jgi:hypothetical protein
MGMYIFYIIFALVALNLFIGLVTDWYPKIRKKSHNQWHYILTRDLAFHVWNNFSFRCNGVGNDNSNGSAVFAEPNKLESVYFKQAIQIPIYQPSLLRGTDGTRYWRKLSAIAEHRRLVTPRSAASISEARPSIYGHDTVATSQQHTSLTQLTPTHTHTPRHFSSSKIENYSPSRLSVPRQESAHETMDTASAHSIVQFNTVKEQMQGTPPVHPQFDQFFSEEFDEGSAAVVDLTSLENLQGIIDNL